MDVTLFGRTLSLDESYLDGTSRDDVRGQLRAYERGERERFDLGVRFPTTFTGRVWRAVAGIGYGETRTYGELAADLGTAPVAVGSANARNPLPVVVPCHRVVGTDSLRGYRYPGLKERLLTHENEAGLAALGFGLDGSV